MATQAVALPYIDHDWELGQPGSRYMLYYLGCDPESVSGVVPKEVTLHSWMETEHIKQLKAMRESVVGEGQEPAPYGPTRLSPPTEVGGGQDARQHGDPWDQGREASASVAVGESLQATPTGLAPTGQDPRAKTQERVKESGDDIAMCFGFR
ncbi:hypothetical protein INS49_015207 [Diaporthe citri]|uniref:uncharacterized protein n=1 Tax=Diaporthe citri TaxID=83186 RepID=UPI001C807550|nr:uncharacterized protein INS49_015207 [Diaporthe citri]KAG6357329.1 hypothetical protein INS49_015207 [Diaporthe citri]